MNAKSNILLSWTNYKILLQVFDEKARDWYAKETPEQTWITRTLQRNISTHYLLYCIDDETVEYIKEKENVNEKDVVSKSGCLY